jgi:hypothetical protein
MLHFHFMPLRRCADISFYAIVTVLFSLSHAVTAERDYDDITLITPQFSPFRHASLSTSRFK